VVVAALVIALVLALSGGGGYTVHAHFVSASQIVEGNEVRVSGKAVGSVQDVALTPDGQADITLSVEEDGYFPLRRGTRATVRLASLSGVANRYNAYQPPGSRPDTISQALPSFDCKPSEKPPTSTPGCKIAGPIPFDNVEQFFPNVREGGPGGTPAGG